MIFIPVYTYIVLAFFSLVLSVSLVNSLVKKGINLAFIPAVIFFSTFLGFTLFFINTEFFETNALVYGAVVYVIGLIPCYIILSPLKSKIKKHDKK